MLCRLSEYIVSIIILKQNVLHLLNSLLLILKTLHLHRNNKKQFYLQSTVICDKKKQTNI